MLPESTEMDSDFIGRSSINPKGNRNVLTNSHETYRHVFNNKIIYNI